MADPRTTPWQACGNMPGRSGENRPARTPGVRVVPRNNLGVASIIGRRDAPDLLSELARRLGVEPPTTPRMVQGRDSDLIWSGAAHWLSVSATRDSVQSLAGMLTGVAAVADQSDARIVLRASGPNIRDVLAKGCLIDLHPRAFRPGDAALTSIAHIGVQLWAVDAATFDLAVPRSMAASFWSWFRASAAEYGLEIVAPGGTLA